MDQPSKGVPTVKVEVTAAQVEAAVSAAANAASLPTAEVIGKQPMTQFHQVSLKKRMIFSRIVCFLVSRCKS